MKPFKMPHFAINIEKQIKAYFHKRDFDTLIGRSNKQFSYLDIVEVMTYVIYKTTLFDVAFKQGIKYQNRKAHSPSIVLGLLLGMILTSFIYFIIKISSEA